MGFGRDHGAALTMGLSATTKHKNAQKAFDKSRDSHERRVRTFNETFQRTANSIQRLEGEYASARDALTNTGAMKVDDEGIVNYGWYRPVEETQADADTTDRNQAIVGSLPAFGVAVGAPALTWTLVGAFGTAATGTAISALSGAAAGAATAAWIGRAATFGLVGMTAGRVALGPIAMLSAPVQIAIGAKVAGNRERRAIEQYREATNEMNRREGIMSDLNGKLTGLDQQANARAADLSRHANQLEIARPGGEEANQAAARLDIDMRQALATLYEFADTASKINEKLGDPNDIGHP